MHIKYFLAFKKLFVKKFREENLILNYIPSNWLIFLLKQSF